MAGAFRQFFGDMIPPVKRPTPRYPVPAPGMSGGGMPPPPNWQGIPFRMPDGPPPGGGGPRPPGPPLRDWAPAGALPPPPGRATINATGPGQHGGSIPPRWTPDQQMGVAGLGLAAAGVGLSQGEQIEEQKKQIASQVGASVEEVEQETVETMKAAAETPEQASWLDDIAGKVDLLTVGLALMAGNDGSKSFTEALGGAMLAGMQSKQNKDSLSKKQELAEREVVAAENRVKVSLMSALGSGTSSKSDSTLSSSELTAAVDTLNLALPELNLSRDSENWNQTDLALIRQAGKYLRDARESAGQELSIQDSVAAIRSNPLVMDLVEPEWFGQNEWDVNKKAIGAVSDRAAQGNVVLTPDEQAEIKQAQELGVTIRPALQRKLEMIQLQQRQQR